ncbi:MAG: hypothetical protein OXB91_14115 [Bryobacterales bacterium]|nr:hypothetical protein [Bryobacterales bacterium]
MNRTICVATITATALLLAACGGGGGNTAMENGALGYSSTADVRWSYAPYVTRSHLHAYGLRDPRTGARGEIYIGGDLEPRERLRHVATGNRGIRWFMGASRDGAGVNRLESYEHDLLTSNEADPYELDGNGFFPFSVPPDLYLEDDLLDPENRAILFAVLSGVAILNDALPPEFQLAWEDVTLDTAEIVVRLETSGAISAICGAGAVACATNGIDRVNGYTVASTLYIPDDFDTSEYAYPRSVIVHELLHSLGIWGHVDSVEFPDSIMGGSGGYIPNLGHIVSRIDREVLQIMYMSQRTDIYNDWGEWSDLSHHLMGQSADEAMSFGVALFNGLPQPWVKGVMPDTDLADNASLSGTATWVGHLMGYSGPSPIAGDASLQVGLATLGTRGAEQDLQFRDIYYLNRHESASPDRWFHTRDIDYKVTISGIRFNNVLGQGYEQGLVTGAFLGREHEHMGGTVKRTDLVGAFGGSRE